MKKWNTIVVLVFIFIATTNRAYTQSNNLLLNPGFEEDSFCTLVNAEDGIAAGCAKYWKPANFGAGVAMYLNICSNSITSGDVYTRIPQNSMGYEFPHKGVAYSSVGLYDQLGDGNSYRGYIQGRLRDTLAPLKTYGLIYHVSLGEIPFISPKKFCIDNIGFYFSDTSLFYSVWDTLPFTPQYKNQSGNVLNVRNGWQKVEGKVNVQGGERYVIIGNFDNNSNTHIYDCYGNGADSFEAGELHYYLDDISIIDTSLIDTVNLCMNDSIYLQGAWRKSAGMYYDTVAGMPYRKYIKPISYAETHTYQYFVGNPTDSFKTAYFWSHIFSQKDTTFDVVMPSIHGCDSIIRCRLRDRTIGIGEPLPAVNNSNMLLYPNPANQSIHIHISSATNEGDKLLLYDAQGKMLKPIIEAQSSNSNDTYIHLNTNKLARGIYYIKYIDKNYKTIATGKFSKE